MSEYADKGLKCRHCLHFEKCPTRGCPCGFCGQEGRFTGGNDPACDRFDYGEGYVDEFVGGNNE